ncbi:MAG TPA: cell division protein FtsA [Planctomycetota bacterium]|nr:cell division protein FtsA [Planctomycetota bacterium]
MALRRDGRSFAISAFGEVPRRDADGQARPLASVIAELKKQVPLGRTPCVAHGDLTTLVKYVSTIPLPPDRLQRLLRLELLQAIEADELAADSFPVPIDSDEMIHCCVLTQPAHAHETLKALSAIGIEPSSLHAAQAAVYNSTIPLPPVQDNELALLVDIGATATSVALFGDRRLLACRQLPIGGDTFSAALVGGDGPATAAIEQRLKAGEGMASPFVELAPSTARSPAIGDTGGLELEDDAHDHPLAELADDAPLVLADDHADEPAPATSSAESRAAVAGMTSRLPFEAIENADAVPAPGRTTQQIATRMLGPELTKVAENLYGQLASSLAWFRTQTHAKQLTVKKVLLTGGASGLDGLDTYLQRRFGMPVARFDPCDGLTGKTPERPYEFATAIGLAVAAADTISGTCRLDLTPDGILRQRLWRTRLAWPYVAAACLVLSAALAAWTMLNNQWVAQANLDGFATCQQHHEELKARLEALGKERDGLSEDLRAIAGRVYAGRDLLYTVRALKEQTKGSPELWITSLETVDIAGDAEVSDPKAANSPGRGLPPGRSTPIDKKNAHRDTAIDRGAVDIEGLVKFDDKKTDVEMNRFFEDYNVAIAKWAAGKDATPLFRDDRVIIHLVDRTAKPAAGGTTRRRSTGTKELEPGRFPFKLRFFFQSTRLDDITADGPVSKVPQSVERQP